MTESTQDPQGEMTYAEAFVELSQNLEAYRSRLARKFGREAGIEAIRKTLTALTRKPEETLQRAKLEHYLARAAKTVGKDRGRSEGRQKKRTAAHRDVALTDTIRRNSMLRQVFRPPVSPAELQRITNQVMGRLPHREYTALAYKRHGHSDKEIAAYLGTTPENVRVLRSTALKLVRQLADELGWDKAANWSTRGGKPAGRSGCVPSGATVPGAPLKVPEE